MSRINNAFRIASLRLEKLLNVQPNERIAMMTDQKRKYTKIIAFNGHFDDTLKIKRQGGDRFSKHF